MKWFFKKNDPLKILINVKKIVTDFNFDRKLLIYVSSHLTRNVIRNVIGTKDLSKNDKCKDKRL